MVAATSPSRWTCRAWCRRRPTTTASTRAAGSRRSDARARCRATVSSACAFGVASCANLPFGYFNAYASLARRHDLDAVLHLGDYFYEYQNGKYGDGTKLNRVPSPNKEIVALTDYRERYSAVPSRSRSAGGASPAPVHRRLGRPRDCQRHVVGWRRKPRRGRRRLVDARGSAAVQAYFEWMPVREDVQTRLPRIYRTFSFGDLADLIMLDTRVIGRDEQVKKDDVKGLELPGAHDPRRAHRSSGWPPSWRRRRVRARGGRCSASR